MTFPLGNFLNQQCTYQAFVSSDLNDTPSYAAAQTVVCRFVAIDREHYAKQEDVLQAHSKVWLTFEPVLKSLINGREVISTTQMVCVDGSSPGWTALLR